MAGQQFSLKVQLKLVWKYRIIYVLLVGIAWVILTFIWTDCAILFINYSDSNVETNSSLTYKNTIVSIANEVDKLNFIGEETELFREQKSSRSIIAALEGYNVNIHGFSFENYGNEKDYVQLTSAEVERLFGEQVCASRVDGKCILTPLAQQW